MTTQHLREELERIAAGAPAVEVPDDTWTRGRRSLARARLLVGAAAVAVLAVVVGVVAWPEAPRLNTLPATSGAAGAVPSHVWAVPERMTMQDGEGQWSRDEVSSDLAVGRGAVAFVAGAGAWGVPVVVGADDGAYHLLDLPGFLGNDITTSTGFGEQLPLALSPDGWQLAYAFGDPTGRYGGSDAVPSGVRVVDLHDGYVREIRIDRGRGVFVRTIDWSPDSGRLVWSGTVATSWTPNSWTAGHEVVAGQVGPGSDRSVDVPTTGDVSTRYAIDDDGLVAVITARWIDLDGPLGGRLPAGAPHGASVPVSAQWVDGRLVVVRVDDTQFDYTAWTYAVRGQEPATTSRTLAPGGHALEPLTWIDADHLLTRAAGEAGIVGDQTALDRLAVVAVGADDYDEVGSVEPGVAPLSVAGDLPTVDVPVQERPAPDWPWSDERKVVVGGLAALGLVVLAGAVVTAARRRRFSS